METLNIESPKDETQKRGRSPDGGDEVKISSKSRSKKRKSREVFNYSNYGTSSNYSRLGPTSGNQSINISQADGRTSKHSAYIQY